MKPTQPRLTTLLSHFVGPRQAKIHRQWKRAKMEPKYKEGDVCPACRGKGKALQQRDCHRSEGWIPCTFWTSRRGNFNGQPINFIDLRCHKGKLSRNTLDTNTEPRKFW